MADTLDRIQKREAKVRALERQARVEYRGRIDELLALADTANTDLRAVAHGLLIAVGYRRHNRGEWRMRRELKDLAATIRQLQAAAAKPGPLVNYTAPAGDAEAVEVFAKARAGDEAAQAKVRALILERGWADWLGDLGRQATRQLIHRAAGGDPVWVAGITEKVNTLRRELLGEDPSALDEVLARRVVNGWIATHALELELTLHPPADPKRRDYLDRALSRAQKRLTDAARELARVRRLKLPVVLTQINVAEKQVVATPTPPAALGGS
jgi:hypothetical protein